MSGVDFEHLTFSVNEVGIATVLLDVAGQTMNTLSEKVSQDFVAAISRVEEDPGIRALVVGSAKAEGFIAGADIHALHALQTGSEAVELSQRAQASFARLEALHRDRSKPVVAAMHGPALGGGLELALACSLRVCSDSPKTVLGLPEVKLGLIPGAGGTQRLPRLVGVAQALDMILTGKNIRPRRAKKMGLVDKVVPEAILLDVAQNLALKASRGELRAPYRGLAHLKHVASEMADPEYLQQLALEENTVGLRLLFKKARDALLANTGGHYPAPERALDVVRIGMLEGIKAGFAAEADRFGQLTTTPESSALRGIYFATQSLKKMTGVEAIEQASTQKVSVKKTSANKAGQASRDGRTVHRVAVLGAGLMGAGIAWATSEKAGLPVRLKDRDWRGVGSGLGYARKILDKAVAKKRSTDFERARSMHRITGTIDYSGFSGVDVVIEAVFEDLALKQAVLADVEAHTSDETIFASNTSSIPIGKIAAKAARPENVLGMHYFSPVEKMPLLEIITTPKTSAAAVATCVALGKRQGKTVIVVRDGPGFYTSRILAPYMNEAAWILFEGCSVEALDSALCGFGFPVGPITLFDEVGIDVGIKVAHVMHEALGERMQGPAAMDRLLADKRLGRKNGKGFYLYGPQSGAKPGKRLGVDPSVYGVWGQTASRKDLPIRTIQQRVALQMVNEAALCLQDEILLSPRDGDIGAVFGLGFPPFLGGPFAWIDEVGPQEIVDRLNALSDEHGKRFAPAQILCDYAQSNKRFRGDVG